MIGCTAVAVDFLVYNLVLESICPGCGISNEFKNYFWGLNSADMAKASGFLVGSIYTYYMNKRFTWKQSNRSKRRFARFMVLYSISFIVNIAGNKWALTWSEDFIPFLKLKDVAFFFATGLSVVINFLGQKLWVFNHNISIVAKLKKSFGSN